MTKVKKKKSLMSTGVKLFLIILLIPASFVIYFFVYVAWQELKSLPFIQETEMTEFEKIQENFDVKIPIEYIPIYMEAGEKYNVPWTLLAAHHRVETRFSTTSTLVSPVGAEGHMQFMPCTFVGWKHPTCNGLGKGEIPESEKTNPKVIEKYGGYGVDANGDGKADPFDIEDAIYSAANYLSQSGAKEGNLEQAIFNYNHSTKYVEDVLYFYEQYEQVSSQLENVVLAIRDNEDSEQAF